jgi:hypothetical protein
MTTETTAGGSKKFNAVKQELAGLGLLIKPTGEMGGDGPEYVVKFKDDKNPDHGYFTNDLEDALGTGKAMHKHRQTHGDKHNATANVVDPIFGKNNQPKPSLVMMASSDRVSYTVPKSPLSQQPMEKVQAGAYGQKPFDIWVHLNDRIALPHRTG